MAPLRWFGCVLPGMIVFAASALLAEEPQLSVSSHGVRIDAGLMGAFSVRVPRLMLHPTDYNGEAAASVSAEEKSLTAHYPSGLELRLEVVGSKLSGSYSGTPTQVHGLRFMMVIPLKFNQGGGFAFEEGSVLLFPPEAGKKQLHGATGTRFCFQDELGNGLIIRTPFAYQELQDHRKSGWPVFTYIFNLGIKAGSPGAFEIDLKAARGADEQTPQVDRFGQPTRKDYPGKITTEEELKADVAKDEAYFNGLASPPLDSFGGLPGSGVKYGLQKTGFFHLEKVRGRDVLVDPAGNLFYHLGLCSLATYQTQTLVKGRESIYAWLPSLDGEFATAWLPKRSDAFSFYLANYIRKYGVPYDIESWMARQIPRVRKWGFNSGGVGAALTNSGNASHFPVTLALPLQAWSGRGLTVLKGLNRTHDPFGAGTEEALDKLFAETIAPEANNPNIIGYFIENEVLHENIVRLVPGQKGDSPSKLRLVQLLQEKYGAIEKFNEAWKPKTPFHSFAELGDAPLAPSTPDASADLRAFLELFLTTHFSRAERLFRKHDSKHLLLGSRWQPGTASREEIVRISAKYTDVLSVNYYAYAIDMEFLKRIHRWGGSKPMLMSEWDYTTTDQGLSGPQKEVANQKERGLAYRHYVENTAALPFVIGQQWFTYPDQPLTGRYFEGYNGEGGNTGLINVADRPYLDFVSECKKTNDDIYPLLLGERSPFQFEDPRFISRSGAAKKTLVIPRALPEMKLDGASLNWPGRPPEAIPPANLTHGNPDPDFYTSFRLCWDDENLYVLVEVKDKTPMINPHEGRLLWKGDCVEMFIGAEKTEAAGPLQPGDRQILFGAADPSKAHVMNLHEQPPELRTIVVRNVAGDGYAIEAALPWTALGVHPRDGLELLFDVGVDNADETTLRVGQWMWNGNELNAHDRSGWGRARLVSN